MIYGNTNQIKTPAIAVTYDATISGSTELTLNAKTSIIEVTAIDKAICVRWGTSDASTTAWDHVVPLNSTAMFWVPIEPSTGVLYTAVNFIEQAATAILTVAEF